MFRKLKIFFKSNKNLVLLYALSITIRIFIAILHLFYYKLWVKYTIGTLESYLDYEVYYQTAASLFIHGKKYPYAPNFYYRLPFFYPPFFLYAISLPAIINVDLVFVPLFLADIVLPIFIYQFLKKSLNKKAAKWGFLTSAFCPLTVYYHGGLFLNTSLVILFFVISLYFIHRKKFRYACIFLAVSCLFKQIAIFFVLPILLYLTFASIKQNESRKKYLKNFLSYAFIFFIVLLLGSLPWILIDPEDYYYALSAGQDPTFSPKFKTPTFNSPISWYSFLILYNVPYWVIYLLGFLNFTFLGIVIVQIADLILIIRWQRKGTLDWARFFDIIVYTAILTHLFFPRGVFKYYFAFVAPLIVLWMCFHYYKSSSVKNAKMKRDFFIFTMNSFIILILYRFYYLLIIWLIFFVMLRKNLRLYDIKLKKKE